MEKFKQLTSTCVPLPIENVDTDQIIPARFLKATTREGFGDNLFADWRYYKDGSEALIEQKGKNPRMLTPRECARLQGFPDEFKIVVSDAQAYKQFGNSVAVPAIEATAEKIIQLLSKTR